MSILSLFLQGRVVVQRYLNKKSCEMRKELVERFPDSSTFIGGFI